MIRETKKIIRRFLPAIVAFAVWTVASIQPTAGREQRSFRPSPPHPSYVVIAAKNCPLDSVPKQELARLFLSLTDRLEGTRVSPLNLAETSVKLGFLEWITGLEGEEIENHFIELELIGEGSWPEEVATAIEMAKRTAEEEQTIGWLPRQAFAKIPLSFKSRLKKLLVGY